MFGGESVVVNSCPLLMWGENREISYYFYVLFDVKDDEGCGRQWVFVFGDFTSCFWV